jgi:peptide subunit release factor 1 (eRF1)
MTLNEFYLKRSGIVDYLHRLEDNQGSVNFSVYLPPDMTIQETNLPAISEMPSQVTQIITGSATGGVIFSAGDINRLVLPPFPLSEKVVFEGLVTEPLRSVVERDYAIGLVLVHLGTYAVGVCRGETIISSKVGTGLVHGRTKKGGSSSARYQRRRKNQAREFLERVCEHAREHLSPYEKTLDYLLYGGPHHTIEKLRKTCPFLNTFESRVLPVMDVPALKQKVLEAAITRLWSSRIIEWNSE